MAAAKGRGGGKGGDDLGQEWRLLDTGVRPAAENMALDEVILTARSRDLSPDTIRFLQFHPPCALVGYHQDVEQEVRVDWCREHGVEINRRITGGGALFWDETQIGWEVIAAKSHPGIPSGIEGLYEKLCLAAVSGLRALGVEACFRPRNDIEVNGRKISGTGGTGLDGAFLFQGTLLVDFDVDSMLRALRIPTEKLKRKEIESVKERVTCLKWELGYTPSPAEIKAALCKGFEDALGMSLSPGCLTSAEEGLFAERLPYFRSDDWIRKVRQKPGSSFELRSVRKAPGGLVRVSLALDRSTSRASRLKSVFITGDFFAHPKRAIYDLEARLKNARAEPATITSLVEAFFAERGVKIPGVPHPEISGAILEALKKVKLTQFGIPEGDVNSIFAVKGAFGDILRELNEASRAGPVAILLPYCAKKPGCSYRYREGCASCGQCSIGEAYDMAREFALMPVCIQNYEMLESTLEGLKSRGVSAFIGSCCEAFFAKHHDDFERIGLKGILVDVESSTCYDLGKEKEAHHGRFENQTELKLGLIRKVLEAMKNYGNYDCGEHS
ncbi:MAG: DUF116 domain-containing protein [Firmicutes bacterium]|nr:DUF116 domain-containing protein [Bacillota bacterium]